MKRYIKLIYYLIVFLLFITVLSYTATTILLVEEPATLFSFGLINFAGYLFFLLMPVEALFAYHIAIGNNVILTIIIAVVTALLAQFIDYSVGLFFSKKIIDNLIGEKRFEKYNKIIYRWEGPAILFFNLTPLSSPILLLVAGIVRFNMKKAFIYSAIGLTIKYSFIALLF